MLLVNKMKDIDGNWIYLFMFCWWFLAMLFEILVCALVSCNNLKVYCEKIYAENGMKCIFPKNYRKLATLQAALSDTTQKIGKLNATIEENREAGEREVEVLLNKHREDLKSFQERLDETVGVLHVYPTDPLLKGLV